MCDSMQNALTLRATFTGALVITPNLYTVRHLQDSLIRRLMRMPPIALRAMAFQVRKPPPPSESGC